MNNDMKKFLRKLLLIPLFISCFFVFGAFVIGNKYQESYDASMLDKIARLEAINEPKIILVGGSNLAYGMNSQMLQDAINMPVVNLGLHAGLGSAFNENIAKININSGDIVIACHHNFISDEILDIPLAWITIEYYWNLYNILRPKDYFSMIIGYPNYWFKSFVLWISSEGHYIPDDITYSRKAFNQFGDLVLKPEERRISIEELFTPDTLIIPQINITNINRLNEYNKYIKSKGATLLVAGYPIGSGDYTPPAEEYDKFQRELASKLDCEIISDYRDYFIPYKYFYNTNLHLDNEGADIRTQQLIKDIKRWQNKQNKTGNL